MSDVLFSLMGSGQLLSELASVALQGSLSHATLKCLEKAMGGMSILGSDNELSFPFNPSSLTLNRNPDWDDGDRRLMGYRAMRYAGNRMDKLSFSVLLDESEFRTGGFGGILTALMPVGVLGNLAGFFTKNTSDVLAALQSLYQLTLPHIEASVPGDTTATVNRPPLCAFVWGSFAFTGVVDNMDTTINLFDQDGNPRRAMVTLSMKGVPFTDSIGTTGILEVMDDSEAASYLTETRLAAQLGLTQSALLGGLKSD